MIKQKIIFLGLMIWLVAGPAQATTDLFGTMLAFQTSQGFGGQKKLEKLMKKSWLKLRNSDSFTDFLATMEGALDSSGQLVKDTGFSSNRDVVGAFAWNVIVPEPGEYDWTIPDATLAAAGDAGVTISAVIQPYSSWGSSQTLDPDTCDSIDFYYFDLAAGQPKRWNSYKKFLRRMVERYDGDGVDDMPGLTTRVSAWEVANEVEGDCSGNLNQASRYIKLLRISSATIKQADPTALVLNAGALEIVDQGGSDLDSTKEFWREFFERDGQQYIDVFNMHYNSERDGPLDSMATWQKHLKFFTKLQSDDIPIWVTEFGTLGGKNTDSDEKQSPTAQASWYFRYMVMGMDYGVERYFLDLKGPDGSPVTSGAIYDASRQPRLFFTTLQTLSTLIEGYTAVEKLTTGQYQYTVGTATVYALWDGDLPHALDSSDLVTVYHLNGESETMAGNEVTYSKKQPVLVYSE